MLKALLVRGKTPADPWNRMHCCDRSVLVMIEFCQLQGPRPLFHYPENAGPHLDLDQVAIWLMSSENCHGSQVFLYNQQMDLHAMVYHITMLDITARAFQRPAALAFLSSSKPTLEQRKLFYNLSTELYRPILACNRRVFRSYGERFVDLANEIQHKRLNSYYSLFAREELSPSVNNKIQNVARQMQRLFQHFQHQGTSQFSDSTKPLNLQFLDMFRLTYGHQTLCDCGRNSNDFKRLAEIIEKPGSTELLPLMELAPCASKNFESEFNSLYDKMIHKPPQKGVLFSAGRPVYKSLSGVNLLFKDVDEKEEEQQEGTMDISLINQQFPNENSLKGLGGMLVQCMYPLLSGEKMAVIASDQRVTTAVDLLQKLNMVRVCRVPEQVVWKNDSSTENDDNYATQLMGFIVPRDQSSNFHSSSTRPVIVDLNTHRFISQLYEGQLLQSLSLAKQFPSDESLIYFLVATLSQLCFLAGIAKTISVQELASKLKLKKQDSLMIANILAEYDLERFLSVKNNIQMSIKKSYRKIRL